MGCKITRNQLQTVVRTRRIEITCLCLLMVALYLHLPSGYLT